MKSETHGIRNNEMRKKQIKNAMKQSSHVNFNGYCNLISISVFISVRQSITKLKIAFTEKLINKRFYFSTHNQMSGRDQRSSSLGHLLSSMPYRDVQSL